MTELVQNAPTILRRIIERKQEEVYTRQEQMSELDLRQKFVEVEPPRGFVKALETRITARMPGIVAEIKKASPSKGVIRERFHPAEIARSYEQYGATCLSVLTDVDFFQGSDDHLKEARAACNLPVIRKDFIIDPYQVTEARALGADCILLIAAALDDTRLSALYRQATGLGMDVLIEVHNREELERVLPLESKLIGINNRDLHDFTVDLNTTYTLMDACSDRLIITESGILNPEDVTAMKDCGVYGFLVGEAFMRAENPGARMAELFFGGD